MCLAQVGHYFNMSLAGYSSCRHKESVMTGWATAHGHTGLCYFQEARKATSQKMKLQHHYRLQALGEKMEDRKSETLSLCLGDCPEVPLRFTFIPILRPSMPSQLLPSQVYETCGCRTCSICLLFAVLEMLASSTYFCERSCVGAEGGRPSQFVFVGKSMFVQQRSTWTPCTKHCYRHCKNNRKGNTKPVMCLQVMTSPVMKAKTG